MVNTENTSQDIERLSRLARIGIPESTHDRLIEDIGRILQYLRALDAVDVESVLPTYYGIEHTMSVREDVIQPSTDAAALVDRSPKHSDGQIQVKGIFSDAT